MVLLFRNNRYLKPKNPFGQIISQIYRIFLLILTREKPGDFSRVFFKIRGVTINQIFDLKHKSDPSGTRTPNTLIKSQLLCQIELMGRSFAERSLLYSLSSFCHGFFENSLKFMTN